MDETVLYVCETMTLEDLISMTLEDLMPSHVYIYICVVSLITFQINISNKLIVFRCTLLSTTLEIA
jgi:hypothetical protein